MKIASTSIVALLPLAQAYCPPTGPVLPPPSLSKCPGNLTSGLRSALGDISEKTAATFSVQITSKDKTFFEYHHAGSGLANVSATDIDGDSLYRLASVTKLFTVFSLLLQEDVNLDEPAAKYVAELDNVPGYEHTTLRMLASQLGGVPRDGYMFDLTSGIPPEMMEQLGLPAIEPPPEVPKCDALTLGEDPCTRSQFFDVLAGAGRLWQPGHKATYSNLAFIILGFAIENITGNAYVDVMREQVTAPLEMDSTAFEILDPERLVVPESGLDLAFLPVRNYNATGGLYSTPNDLNKFLRAILNNSLLPGAATAAWLKPQAFTSSPLSSVGAPWEIFRPTTLLPASRPLDVYTKSGGLPGYNAYVAVIPEFDVAFSINVAGGGGEGDYVAIRELFSAVLENVIPGLDALARAQAEAKYAGTYASTISNATSSITLRVDDGPGLKVADWTLLDNSVLTIVAQLRGAKGPDALDVRAYPVGKDERWLLVIENVSEEEDTSVYAGTCETWFTLDQMRFAGLPTDEIDFVVEEGVVRSAVSPGLRMKMDKVEE